MHLAEPGHERHDLELVARAAAGDLAAGEVMAARRLLASCATCAAIATDLGAIASATRELGAAGLAAAPPPAPRDFRLSEADAARVRGRGIRGLGLGFGGTWRPAWIGDRARGLGGALATLGLVGLLVTAGLPGLAGGAASQPTDLEFGATEQTDQASAAPAMAPLASDGRIVVASGDPSRAVDATREGGPSPITVAAILTGLSVAALLLGIALLLGDRAARRDRS